MTHSPTDTTPGLQQQHTRIWDAVIDDIWNEREWALEHRNTTPMLSYQEWLCLIAEELGEAAKDANAIRWSGGTDGRLQDIDRELIQIAQLAISAVIWSRTR